MNLKTGCLAISIIAISGCGSSPDCGSSAAEAGVIKIIKQGYILDGLYGTELANKQKSELNEATKAESNRINNLLEQRKEIDKQIALKTDECTKYLQNTEEYKSRHRNAPDYGTTQGVNFYNYTIWRCSVPRSSSDVMARDKKLNELVNSVNPSLVVMGDKFYTSNLDSLSLKVREINDSLIESTAEEKKILEKKSKELTEVAQKNFDNAKIKLFDIVTVKKNNDTGTVLCKTKLKINVKDLSDLELPYQFYKVEKTSSGEFLVTGVDPH